MQAAPSSDPSGAPPNNITSLVLNPKRVSVLISKGKKNISGYRVKELDNKETDYPILHNTRSASKKICDIFHIKEFHPINKNYGLSQMDVTRYSIDQCNEISSYCKSLLQISARLSGALVVKANKFNQGGTLTEEQFERLKEQIDSVHTEASETGRAMLLKGGLDPWREISISPREVDLIKHRNSLAREIALAFGVPPQILGITRRQHLPATRATPEEQCGNKAVIPVMSQVLYQFSSWLAELFKEPNLVINFDRDQIPALEERRDNEWRRISESTFLANEEKRQMLGL